MEGYQYQLGAKVKRNTTVGILVAHKLMAIFREFHRSLKMRRRSAGLTAVERMEFKVNKLLQLP